MQIRGQLLVTSADLSSNNQDCRGLIFPGVFSSYDMAYKQYSVAFYSSTHWGEYQTSACGIFNKGMYSSFVIIGPNVTRVSTHGTQPRCKLTETKTMAKTTITMAQRQKAI